MRPKRLKEYSVPTAGKWPNDCTRRGKVAAVVVMVKAVISDEPMVSAVSCCQPRVLNHIEKRRLWPLHLVIKVRVTYNFDLM